jgi:ubiquitin thioesterase OTU1
MSDKKPIKLRARTPTNATLIIDGLDTESTIGDLLAQIETKGEIAAAEQQLLNGFPPKEIAIDDTSAKLTQLGIKNGDQLVVKKKGTQTGIVQGKMDGPYIPPSDTRGYFVRRNMPGDNSCLFHSCSYVLENKSKSKAKELRELCANIVLDNPQVYNTAFLGMPNHNYVNSILDPNSWGGAIELSILSNHYKCEIVAFDIQTTREDHYGEDKNYTTRALVLYTGNHYDALALAAHGGASETTDQVRFSASDKSIAEKARAYIKEEHQKYLRGAR